MTTPAIGGLAPWFGSKRTLAPRVVAELGKHCSYWEPFCGSAAVLFAKPISPMEVINDLHGDLINLARVVASDKSPELYGLASRVLMHTDSFSEAKARVFAEPIEPAAESTQVDYAHVGRALDFLVMSWQGRNGSSGTQQSNQTVARRFTHNGGSGGMRWRSAVESIPAWHERLRAVQILRMDAIEMLTRIGDQDKSVIYADPPYIAKGSKYLFDFESSDHQRLADALRRFTRTRVIVSYYEHPRLTELYPGWTVVPVPITKALVNQGKRDAKGDIVKAPEILIINGPSYTLEAAA